MSKVGVCALAILIGALAKTDQSRAEDQARIDFEVFAALANEWRENVSFACDFDYRETMADTFEDAVAGRDSALHPERRAEGGLYKQGMEVRLRFVPIGERWKDPFDEVTDQRLQIRHMIKADNVGNSVYLTKRDPRYIDTVTPGMLSQGIVTPLSPFGDFSHSYVEFFTRREPADKEYSVIEESGAREYIISFTNHGEKIVQRVRVSDSSAVDQIFTTISGTVDGNAWQVRRLVTFSRFRQCGDGVIASNVRRIMEPRKGPVRVTEWVSDNIRQPKEDEPILSLAVPYGANVAGVSRVLDLGTPPTIVVSELKDDALGSQVFVVEAPPPRLTQRRLVTVGVFAALLSAGMFLVVRRRVR